MVGTPLKTTELRLWIDWIRLDIKERNNEYFAVAIRIPKLGEKESMNFQNYKKSIVHEFHVEID